MTFLRRLNLPFILQRRCSFNRSYAAAASEVRIVSLEGNIGCGKTTMWNYLKHQYASTAEVSFLREPVDLWQTSIRNAEGASLFQLYLNDPKKYGFPFQLMVRLTRINLLQKQMKETPNAKVIVCERSLQADESVFAKMLHDQGFMDDVSYQVYSMLCKSWTEIPPLSMIIYLRATPEVCLQRIARRGRPGEAEGISLEYLKDCHSYHEDWILSMNHVEEKEVSIFNKNTSARSRVLILDVNDDASSSISQDDKKNGDIGKGMVVLGGNKITALINTLLL